MTTGEHDEAVHADPAAELLDVAAATVPAWLERVVHETARRHDIDLVAHGDALTESVGDAADVCLRRLERLLDTDVDEQRTNPLSLLRDAVVEPSRRLIEWGASPPELDEFSRRSFPDDPFQLGPANWNDVHADLHTAGITWGAWKAMTVLRRRRALDDRGPGTAPDTPEQ